MSGHDTFDGLDFKVHNIDADDDETIANGHGIDIMCDPQYGALALVLRSAFCQAAYEKGKERHAEDGLLFEEQISCRINREYPGYALGQASKKMAESKRMPKEHAIRELLGAINFLAIEVITRGEE